MLGGLTNWANYRGLCGLVQWGYMGILSVAVYPQAEVQLLFEENILVPKQTYLERNCVKCSRQGPIPFRSLG